MKFNRHIFSIAKSGWDGHFRKSMGRGPPEPLVLHPAPGEAVKGHNDVRIVSGRIGNGQGQWIPVAVDHEFVAVMDSGQAIGQAAPNLDIRVGSSEGALIAL